MTSAAERIILGYLEAKKLVSDSGYDKDIIWAEDLADVKPNTVYVLREFAWVVVNSGFRNKVAQKLWPGLLEAFHEFDPEKVTWECFPVAQKVLNHRGKLEAICDVALEIRAKGIEQILEDAQDPQKLTRLPYIGKVTCYHFAKVLGADVVKPDVHLTRAAKPLGMTPLWLCENIHLGTGDRLALVDTVLWRYGEQMLARNWPSWRELWGVNVP